MDKNNPETLSQVIKHKERELQEFNELRYAQLTSIIAERDALLLDSAKRFEQLKEDFHYNLTLIEARDFEIDRLEKLAKQSTINFDDVDSQRKNVIIRLDSVERRESENRQKWDNNRVTLQATVNELLEVIKSLQFEHTEEINTKNREISQLIKQNEHLNTLRENALESQRYDLTTTFENMLQQAHNSKESTERDIAKQIGELELRYERIQTENHRIKSERDETNRLCEQLRDEMSAKEELRRQTQWQLDDERSVKTVADDTLQRSLRQALIDLAGCKDSKVKEISDLQKTITKMTADLAREKDFREHLEKHVEELKLVFEHDKRSLDLEIHEHRVHESLQHVELEALREDRDSALSRAASVRLELEAIEAKAKNAYKECDLVRSELKAERGRAVELESQMRKDRENHQKELEEVHTEKSRHQQQASEQILDNKSRSHDETARLRAQHKEDLAACRQLHLHELQTLRKELAEKVTLGDERVTQKDQEVEVTKELLLEARREAANMRTDRDAMQLRLSIREAELEKLSRQTAAIGESGRLRFATGGQGGVDNFSLMNESGLLEEQHEYLPRNRSEDDSSPTGRPAHDQPYSPAFSLDMGSVSIPGSPDFKPSSGRPGGAGSPLGRFSGGVMNVTTSVGARVKPSASHSTHLVLQQQVDELHFQLEQEQQRARRLEEERDKTLKDNAALRERIKEMSLQMRQTMEELSSLNTSQQHPEQDPQTRSPQQAVLEQRVAEQAREISRLQRENKDCMDVNNQQHADIKELRRRVADLSGQHSFRSAGRKERDESRSLFNDEPHSQKEWRGLPDRDSFHQPPQPSPMPHPYSQYVQTPMDYGHHEMPLPPARQHVQTIPLEPADLHSHRVPVNPWNMSAVSSAISSHREGHPTSRVFSTPVATPLAPLLSPRDDNEDLDAFGERKTDLSEDHLSMQGRAVTPSFPSGYTNRGLSVFHNKSGTPLPISNSDRTTASQLKALNSLKINRKSQTSNNPPAPRNYAKGEDV